MRNRIRTGSSPSIQVPPEDAQPLAILRIEFREFQTLPCCLKSKTLELDQSMAKAWRSSAWRKQTLQCLLLQGDTRRFHLDRSYRMFLTYSYFNTEKAPTEVGGLPFLVALGNYRLEPAKFATTARPSAPPGTGKNALSDHDLLFPACFPRVWCKLATTK